MHVEGKAYRWGIMFYKPIFEFHKLLSSQRISQTIISSLCDFFIFSMSSRKLSTVWKQENTTMIVKKEDVSDSSNSI